MKRVFSLQTIACLCLIGFALSCSKRGDFEVNCKVLRVAQNNVVHPGGEDFEGIFSYNGHGDPTQIIWSYTTTGRPNYYFKYDNKHRLVTYYGAYEGSAGHDFYTKYTYGANNMIVSDSTYLSAPDINHPADNLQYGYIYTTYQYDSKGRVKQVDLHYSQGFTVIQTFTYDANGNKIRGDGAVYDNKKSWLRTNLVLAFIMRDYSMNNYKVADTYNNKSLPTSFFNSGGVSFINSIIDEIDYDCGHNH